MQTINIENAKKPLFSWCPDLEPNALEQMKVIAQLPFVRHCAIMPDGHLGKNMCIGGVVATEGVVVCDFVGVDIGCGVCVLKSSLKKTDLLDVQLREKIHHSACRGIPMGFSHNTSKRVQELKQIYSEKVRYIFEKTNILNERHQPLKDVEDAFYSQCGTLGGGNHFFSLDYDENDDVWMMFHSGSRNMGLRIGEYFNKVAGELNKKWYSVDTHNIPFLPTETNEGKAYLNWMDFALRFAFLNRQVMMDELKRTIVHILPNTEFYENSMINIHHNYASLERHFGKDVWVHRKGAVLAREGVKGVIPGSMGTGSFITEGLGNTQSLCSSSHGAGRTKGRTAFNIEMNTPDKIQQIKKSMEGIVYSGFGKSSKGRDAGMLDVSESPAAYRNIESVMDNQKDLIKPIHKLTTLVNWKDGGEE